MSSEQKVFEYIDQIAAKLGVAAEHAYPLLIKQQRINGVMDLLFGIAAIILIPYCIRWTVKLSKHYDYDIYAIVPIIVGIIAAIFGPMALYYGVGELLNPEYYAIKDILSILD